MAINTLNQLPTYKRIKRINPLDSDPTSVCQFKHAVSGKQQESLGFSLLYVKF